MVSYLILVTSYSNEKNQSYWKLLSMMKEKDEISNVLQYCLLKSVDSQATPVLLLSVVLGGIALQSAIFSYVWLCFFCVSAYFLSVNLTSESAFFTRPTGTL